MTGQPALQRAIDALHAAARLDSPPADAADLESRLATVHSLTLPCLLDALGDLIENLARHAAALTDITPAERDLIAAHLQSASERLSPVGESIDRARTATGSWTR